MSLLALDRALKATGIPTYHFTAVKEDDKYIVWLEEGERSYFRTADTHTLWADDHVAQQAIASSAAKEAGRALREMAEKGELTYRCVSLP